VPSQTPNLR